MASPETGKRRKCRVGCGAAAGVYWCVWTVFVQWALILKKKHTELKSPPLWVSVFFKPCSLMCFRDVIDDKVEGCCCF